MWGSQTAEHTSLSTRTAVVEGLVSSTWLWSSCWRAWSQPGSWMSGVHLTAGPRGPGLLLWPAVGTAPEQMCAYISNGVANQRAKYRLFSLLGVFLVAQLVRNPPAMWETWIRYLGCKDPLEKKTATHSSLWPGECLGLYSPWGRKESDMTEWFSLHFSLLERERKRKYIPWYPLQGEASSASMLETASLTCFLLPLLLQSYIIPWLRGPCSSAWLLKSLCLSLREIIWPCWPINSYNKMKRLTHPSECWPLRGDVLQDWRAF